MRNIILLRKCNAIDRGRSFELARVETAHKDIDFESRNFENRLFLF